MESITVTAKVSGYHPVTGLYLVQGQEYRIAKAAFAADVFDPKIQNSKSKITAPEGSE